MNTIRDYINSLGFIILVNKVKRWSKVEVVYYNGEYEDSKTFLVEDVFSENGQRRLEELFNSFCEMNGIKKDSVTDVCILNTSDTKEMPMVVMTSA